MIIVTSSIQYFMFGDLRSIITKERNLRHRFREHFGGGVHCMVHSHSNQKGGQEFPQGTQPSFPLRSANPGCCLQILVLEKCCSFHMSTNFPILFLTCSISFAAMPCECGRASALFGGLPQDNRQPDPPVGGPQANALVSPVPGRTCRNMPRILSLQ